MKFFVNLEKRFFQTRLFIGKQFDDGTTFRLAPFTWEKMHQGEEIAALMTEESIEFMQAICDAAFEAGIYPKQLQDRSNELAATKYHLEDMRKIALHDYEPSHIRVGEIEMTK